MKKRKTLIIVLTILNLMLFIGGIIGLVGTSKNNKIINSIDREFAYQESGNGEVNLTLPSGKNVALQFGKTAVKIIDSSVISDRENNLYIILFVRDYAGRHGIDITRTNSDLLGEYRLHTYLFRLGYKQPQTKDADLEYGQDRRWYVRFAGTIIGWFGI